MHQEQRERTRELLKGQGIEQALFANYDSIKWLTGFIYPVQRGAHPFSGGPALVWYESGHFTLLVLDAYLDRAQIFAEQPGCAVESYPGYSFLEPVSSADNLAAALRRLIKARPGTGRLGLEARDVPLFLAAVLQEEMGPRTDQVKIDAMLVPVRMVKTGEEIEKLRENFALTDIGHAAAREAVREGKQEIEVWNHIHSAIQKAAGRRVVLGEDCLVGHRQENISGWPLDYRIGPHDSFIADLAPCLNGYWGDSAGTYYPHQPTPEQVKMHRAVFQGLEFGASLLRPGTAANKVDEELRNFMAKTGYPVYPHHSGHSVGVSLHEAPRLVPNNEVPLQPGMVIMLEPGIYLPGETGVRLEDAFLITQDGAETLTRHDKSWPGL